MERVVAGKFGGHRIPGSGVQRTGPLRGDAIIPDPRFHIECKYRQAFSFHRTFKDEEVKAKQLGRVLLLVTKQAGDIGELVTLRLDEFLSLVEVQR